MHLIKDAAKNHAASSSGIVCDASDSLMMYFQKGTFVDPISIFHQEFRLIRYSGNTKWKSSSRLKDMFKCLSILLKT